MTIKTFLTATVLAVAPGLAFAACSGHKEATMTCADGMVYDSATQSCTLASG
ncbi:hypothetical protein GCM10011415_23870 [Salipiger pallidus]|uniref:Chitin-binding type-2 domain-containing protein n=1 Tax=Salipiger pallidus TaxID=1775170 RepID=A0A8J3EG84_9RHOB|nr:carbohydrate-binding module family 14 protein [Salipiger pallidus]GGG74615.1 hypothetical protein GCM10011415_23870 [Salipiger pallidus]